MFEDYKNIQNLHRSLVRMSNNLNRSREQIETRKEELKQQGKVSDLEKISLLKQQLYCAARDGEDTTEIIKAIKTIRGEYEINRPRNIDRHNTIVNKTLVMFLVILASVVVSDASQNCYRTQSTFCNQLAEFNRTIDRYFYGDRQP